MDSSDVAVDNLHNIESVLDTTHLINEIEDLETFLTMPLSVSLSETSLGQSLAVDAWKLRSSQKPSLSKSISLSVGPRNSAAMRSQLLLMTTFRKAAQLRVKKMPPKERTRLLNRIKFTTFHDLLKQYERTLSSNSETDAAEDEKRVGKARLGYSEEEEESSEDSDDLTRLVRRQKEAFSARVAAGRPSIRSHRASSEQGNEKPPSYSCLNQKQAQDLLSKNERIYRRLVKQYVGKATRLRATARRDKLMMAKRAARECAKAVRQRIFQKSNKDSTTRGRRLAREISAYWCVRGGGASQSHAVLGGICHSTLGVDGQTGEKPEDASTVRRKAERAMAEQRKADLELLEARRQQRKLNFLLTQTELYAHFMSKKMSVAPTDEGAREVPVIPDDEGTVSILSRLEVPLCEVEDEESNSTHTSAVSSSLAKAARAAAGRLGLDDVDDYDPEAMKTQLLSSVSMAVERDRLVRSDFDAPSETARNSQPKGAIKIDDEEEDAAAADDDMENQKEELPNLPDVTRPPSIFNGELKAYQLRGLTWLLTLFDQGINGILADEMGLGKTIQTIAFMGSLAENYNLWGPFLIVTPASTLHNWTQEFTKFMPAFRLVPYWGSPTERKVLRRFWSNSTSEGTLLGTPQAPFHVVITSYQVVLQDAKFINKTAWTYIVLDEAHAIKSTNSLRWKILLSFRCRNRLLLTGTPIQNAMRELWALLHFIMPALFDSHDEFADWFSKDIESQAISGGDQSSVNPAMIDENQLSRLRLILKPFMLRRIKTEVELEIAQKTEVLVYCFLTRRQKDLYNRLKSKIRIEDLNDGSGACRGLTMNCIGGYSIGGDASTTRLMNLVMQLRKVCNHPDLFDRRDVGFSCTSIRPYALFQAHWWLPRLLFEEGLLPGQTWRSLRPLDKSSCGWMDLGAAGSEKMAVILHLFLFLTADHFLHSYWHNPSPPTHSPSISIECDGYADCFSAARLSGHNFNDLGLLISPPKPEERTRSGVTVLFSDKILLIQSRSNIKSIQPPFMIHSTHFSFTGQSKILASYHPESTNQSDRMISSELTYPSFIYSVILLPVCVSHVRSFCSAPNILSSHDKIYGFPMKLPSQFELPPPPRSLQLVSPGGLIADSGKLKELDRLLTCLKPGGHRVLIYSQMTKMIDLLEELMMYRGYNYLRLDGSSRLCDRRDMVAQWQTDPRWFVFLLSTRAGGLGINLTAADTVIFYDSDWNPTVDQQAMDRAHRLGQLKEITVYRLISKGTVEGRMLQRAEEKRAMQRMVIAGGGEISSDSFVKPTSNHNTLTQSEMVSLLLDDDELAMRLAQRRRAQAIRGRPSKNPTQQSSASYSATTGDTFATTSATSNVDSILNKKKLAAWPERARGGGSRAKKPRTLE